MRRAVLTFVAIVWLAVLGASQAQAVMLTYTYNGQDFTDLSGSFFTTSDNVSGFMTVDCSALGGAGDCTSVPFPSLLNTYNAAVTDYSFSAGGITIDPSSNPMLFVQFATDSSAAITEWQISLIVESVTEGSFRIATNRGNSPGEVGDSAAVNDFMSTASNERAGTWTSSTLPGSPPGAVSAPATLATWLVGLLALAWMLWRRRTLKPPPRPARRAARGGALRPAASP